MQFSGSWIRNDLEDAHTLENEPPENWEPLEKHLDDVANLASQFAAKFGASEWGHLTGLWHDLGKYSKAFQAYLHKENGFETLLEQYKGRVDHATAGAQLASEKIQPWGRMLAYAIAGHHTGLANATGGQSSLDERLRKSIEFTPTDEKDFDAIDSHSGAQLRATPHFYRPVMEHGIIQVPELRSQEVVQ